jgi:hypothetical protein
VFGEVVETPTEVEVGQVEKLAQNNGYARILYDIIDLDGVLNPWELVCLVG